MKVTTIIAAAVVALISVASGVTAQGSTSTSGSFSGSGPNVGETPTVYNETVTSVDVPIGEKTYNTGLRTIEDGPNRCGGALISPIHVLTSSSCLTRDIRWAAVGAHFYNGTQGGERIKVVAMITHPKYNDYSNDLMVLELEKPSTFKPVALPAADDSDIKTGEWGTVFGWRWLRGNDTMPNRRARELQSAEVKFMSNQECSKMMLIDDTMVCVSGLANEDPCQGMVGSPVVVNPSNGNLPAEDVLVGVVSWGLDCNVVNVPSVLARISNARSWIDSIIGGTCSS
ncbi:hypothetical protein PHYBOEH_008624 [Phytophthora boehmeriae]|uniref:Peptidase S1 domain-containing protein n=1 Tax=Phytophthora boehmeriae TaxID=109152 RepID=A0A8T1W3L9_9STRA|nr:hypothetical protein PHYBOEH_008624 [Phytophthora boehmeriae]